MESTLWIGEHKLREKYNSKSISMDEFTECIACATIILSKYDKEYDFLIRIYPLLRFWAVKPCKQCTFLLKTSCFPSPAFLATAFGLVERSRCWYHPQPEQVIRSVGCYLYQNQNGCFLYFSGKWQSSLGWEQATMTDHLVIPACKTDQQRTANLCRTYFSAKEPLCLI